MKKYPFSVQKHAHDIEFRMNRCWLEMHDMLDGEAEWDEETYDKLDALHEALVDLLNSIRFNGNGVVAYLTGKEIGLAKETVMWARNRRASSLIQAGKTEYLRYC